MTSTVSQVNDYASTAAAAIAAENYAAAIAAALQAKILLAVMPAMQRSAAGNLQQMGWTNVQAIDSFIQECRRLQNAGQHVGPWSQTKIRFASSRGGSGDY